MNLDFNALRTLRLVFRLGSYSAAAEAIGVKQSTVSYTIDRLRKALDDPLIVRQGGRNVPTDRCRTLIPMIDRVLAEADSMAFKGTFDPSRAKADISIVCSTFGLKTFLPGVFQRLHREAPGVRVGLVQRYSGVADLLLEGRVDLAVAFAEIDDNGIYAHRRLFTDYPVCIMDPGNPLVGKTLTVEDISRSGHIGAEIWSNWKQPYIAAAEKLGATIRQVAMVTDQVHAPALIQGTDLIGGMPSTMARAFGEQLGIAYFPFTIEVVLNMYWSAASNRSPLNDWLRQVIVEEVNKMVRPLLP